MNLTTIKNLLRRILLGQALSFLMSVTGVCTTKLVERDLSFPLLQSLTAYLFIWIIYTPFYIFIRYRYRGAKFSDFSFMSKWWKYAILAVIDLEANFCVVMAYQYTDIMSAQLLNCFTIPCVLVLSFFILKMKFALTHVLGCIVAIGGLALLIALDADGLSRNVGGREQLLGDALCLLASSLYATSNVLTEWFIKPPKVSILHTNAINESETPLDTTEPTADECRLAAEDTCSRDVPVATVTELNDGLPDEISPTVPAYIPVVENLAMMSSFAVLFATAQFFAVEWKSFAPRRDAWSQQDWLFQLGFGLTMLCVYTGMPTLFLLTSAAFTNISLLTASIYAILWNVTIFAIYPTKVFFVAYLVIVTGIVLYSLSDVVRFRFCERWNYPCGDAVVESSSNAGDNTGQSDQQCS